MRFSLMLLILLNLKTIYGMDYCFKSGKFGEVIDYMLYGHVFDSQGGKTFHNCMKRCLEFRLCQSLNFVDYYQCQLNLKTASSHPDTYVQRTGAVYMDRSAIPKGFAGHCQNHECALDSKCYPTKGGWACLIYGACARLPQIVENSKYNVTMIDGVRTATYSCVPPAINIGSDTSVTCHLPTGWTTPQINCTSEIHAYCDEPPSTGTPTIIARPVPKAALYQAWYVCSELSGSKPIPHCPITNCTGIKQWSTPTLSCSEHDCFATGNYTGKVACTVTGVECQNWKADKPHVPLYDFGDHNYCRPSEGYAPWCYTLDPNERWNYCPVQNCACVESPKNVTNAEHNITMKDGLRTATYSCVPPAINIGGNTSVTCHILTGWSTPQINCTSELPAACDEPTNTEIATMIVRPAPKATLYQAWYVCSELSGSNSIPHCPIANCTGIRQWSTPTLSCSEQDCFANGRYTGKVACTVTGVKCQNWKADKPHVHSETFGDHNYCRPSEGYAPWCYTLDPNERWDYCPVPNCVCVVSPTTMTDAEYSVAMIDGVRRATYSCVPPAINIGGDTSVTCHKQSGWTSPQINCTSELPAACGEPPATENTTMIVRPALKTSLYQAWYVCSELSGSNPIPHCPIANCTGIKQWSTPTLSCSEHDCFANGSYTGKVACTVTGVKCQNWKVDKPHVPSETFGDHNYCRPTEGYAPWCYTLDPNERWDYCPVPNCACIESPKSMKNAEYIVTMIDGVKTATYSCVPPTINIGGDTSVTCHKQTGWKTPQINCTSELPAACGEPLTTETTTMVVRPAPKASLYQAWYVCSELSGSNPIPHCPIANCTGIKQWSTPTLSCSELQAICIEKN